MIAAPPRRRRQLELPVDLSRLCDVIARDRRQLEPFRRTRLEMVRQYAGARYGENAAAAEVPVNLLGLYVEVITQSLIDNAPRAMLSTFDVGRRAEVAAHEQWLNDELVRMNVAEAYKRVIYDALFCVGIMKLGIATPADAAAEAWDVQAGQPFMESIDLDDFTCDTTARTLARCAYHACRYRIPVDLANELYAKGRADKFEADDRTDSNEGGDERIHALMGTTGSKDELEDSCDLWEVYLARHKLIVTLRDDAGTPDSSKPPVRVQPWVGPVTGPYHFLGFGVVPGNLMPKGPIMDLYDLHRHYNGAYRKLMRRTRDTKKITVYESSQTDDAKRFKDANDGDMVEGRNPAGINTVETGGPTQDLVTMSDHIKANFSFRGGNLELLGGRAAQSRTASQDKMLNENAGAGISHLSDAFLAFVSETLEGLVFYTHYHPTKVMQSYYSPKGAPDLKFTRNLRPQDRTGRPPQVKVAPYSMARQTPGARLEFIKNVIGTLAPLMPLAAQQGHLPDLGEILKLFAKYGDDPDIITIFGLGDPIMPGSGGDGGSGGGMPSATTRTYERYGSGGASSQAQKQDLAVDVSQMGAGDQNSGGQ